MNHWTIGKRVTCTCSILVALVIITGVAGVFGLSRVNNSLPGMATDSVPGILALNEVRAAGAEIRGTSLLMALPGLPEYKGKQLARLADLEQKIPKILHDYDAAGFVSPEERSLFEDTQKTEERLITACSKLRELTIQGKLAEASEFWKQEGSLAWPGFRTSIEAEVNYNKRGSDVFLSDGGEAYRVAIVMTCSLLTIATGLGFGLAFVVVRGISASLRKSSDEIRLSAEQVTGPLRRWLRPVCN